MAMHVKGCNISLLGEDGNLMHASSLEQLSKAQQIFKECNALALVKMHVIKPLELL